MKKSIIIISLIIITIFIVLEAIIFLTPSRVPEMKNRMWFTIANESANDITVALFINNENMASIDLQSAIAKGYFGQEFEYFDLNTPTEPFILKVIEETTGVEESAEINPANGDYIDATFWSDKIVIDQTKERQIRID